MGITTSELKQLNCDMVYRMIYENNGITKQMIAKELRFSCLPFHRIWDICWNRIRSTAVPTELQLAAARRSYISSTIIPGSLFQ